MDRSLLEQAAALEPQLIAWRRELHRWPELGFCEMRTSSRIARVLTELGFDQVLVGRDVCDGAGRMACRPRRCWTQPTRPPKPTGPIRNFCPRRGTASPAVVGVLPLRRGAHGGAAV